jgi:hypothetical protein
MERFPYFVATSKAVASGISPAGSFILFSVPDFIFWLKEGVFINKLHVVFRNPFLHNEVLRKLDILPIGFLEMPLNSSMSDSVARQVALRLSVTIYLLDLRVLLPLQANQSHEIVALLKLRTP